MFKRKRLIISLALIFVIIFSFFSVYLRTKYIVPILMYHSISPSAVSSEDRMTVRPEVFENQMRFLKEHAFNVVDIKEIAKLISQKEEIPRNTVAITFDDGYKNFYTYAFPILKKYNLPATVFIIVDEIGRPQNDRLSWEELKVISSSGLISIGDHCLGPEPLINIKSTKEITRQIREAKKILEERLGIEVYSFSYPEGLFNNEIRQIVIDSGFKVAVATNPGRQYPNDDIFALKRLRISSASNNIVSFWIKASGYYKFFKEKKKN